MFSSVCNTFVIDGNLTKNAGLNSQRVGINLSATYEHPRFGWHWIVNVEIRRALALGVLEYVSIDP